MKYRHLFVTDGKAWFIRQVAATTRDLATDEMIYRCDRPLGNQFRTLHEAIRHTDSWYDWFVRWDDEYLQVEADGGTQIMRRVPRAQATPFERTLAYVNRAILVGSCQRSKKKTPIAKVFKVLKRGRPWLSR